jgi:hypothetical protein
MQYLYRIHTDNFTTSIYWYELIFLDIQIIIFNLIPYYKPIYWS